MTVCFHMTPEDFKKDYHSLYGSGFSIAPIFTNQRGFDFIINQKVLKSLFCWS